MTTIAQRRRSLLASTVIRRADVVLEVARVDRGEGRPPSCGWCRQRPAALLLACELEVVCAHGDDCEVCAASLAEAETAACGGCLSTLSPDLLAAVDLAAGPDDWARLLGALSRPLSVRLGFDPATVEAIHPGNPLRPAWRVSGGAVPATAGTAAAGRGAARRGRCGRRLTSGTGRPGMGYGTGWRRDGAGPGRATVLPLRQHPIFDDKETAVPQRIQILLSAGHIVPDGTHLLAQPYLGDDATRWECGIREGRTARENRDAYRAWLDQHPGVVARIRRDLAGMDIGCLCPVGLNVPNVACLGDVVLDIANHTEGE